MSITTPIASSIASQPHAVAIVALLVTTAGTVAVVGTTPAGAAEVSIDGLSASDATFSTDAADPTLDASVAVAYDVTDATADPEMLVLTLAVDGTVVDTVEFSTSGETFDSDTTLSGRVVDSEAWQASDFAPAAGEEVTREVGVTVGMAVEDADGGVIASANASDTASITVVNNGSAVTASIGGTVEVFDANAE